MKNNVIKRVAEAAKVASLSEEARRIIETMLDDADGPSDIVMKDFFNALEDGHYLKIIGANDPDAVEEACKFLETVEA